MGYISQFNSAVNDHDTTTKLMNGGKGHNLIMMHHEGIAVPSGVVISTQACIDYLGCGGYGKDAFLDALMDELYPLLENIRKDSSTNLVSVRSGSPVSMPGMMDTILNVGVGYPYSGLGKQQVALKTDCMKRFVEMFLCVVHGMSRDDFQNTLDDPEHVADMFKCIKKEYPNFLAVLRVSIKAVFESWNTPRAIHYRKMYDISDNLGTAVVIQSMVFGNYNDKSGSGVVFTRNPNNGRVELYGNFLVNCQGEDVVNGGSNVPALDELRTWNPKLYSLLESKTSKLEYMLKDMVDVEFTVENGKLYFLQIREGQRSSEAAIRIALDLKKEKLIDDLAEKIPVGAIGNLRIPALPIDFEGSLYSTGIASGGSIATGRIAKSVDSVLDSNEPTVLVAAETTPNDIKGMEKAVAIVTTTGGVTSHAAVVARGMNKTCVVGCEDLDLFYLSENNYMLVDGKTGNIYCSDKPFDVDTASALNCDLVNELLSLIDTLPHTIIVESMQEVRSLEEHLYKVALPVSSLDEEIVNDDLEYLSTTFDAVVLQNPVRVDSISTFLGDPILPKAELVVIVGKGLESGFPNVMFDLRVSEDDTFRVVSEFRTLADLMNEDFFGRVSDDFVQNIVGGEGTFDSIREQLNLDGRVVVYIDLLEMIEFELGIG